MVHIVCVRYAKGLLSRPPIIRESRGQTRKDWRWLIRDRFYSWRRYCNKHQIRLGGYVMNGDRSESPANGDPDVDEEEEMLHADGLHMNTGQQLGSSSGRNRSPTPPRALYRSTTGKGVAFTREDVRFLTRFMEYRR